MASPTLVTILAFVWGMLGMMVLIFSSPIADPTLSTLVAYLSPLVFGVVAASMARGLPGLVAVILGMLTATVLGTVIGRLLVPLEGELPSRIAAFFVFAALTSLAYGATTAVRSRLPSGTRRGRPSAR